MDVWLRLGDPFVSQSPRGVCASHFLGQMLGYAYTNCSYDHTSISCTIPSGSPCLPSRVYSYTLSVLICCIFIILLIWESSTPTLADGFPVESKWKQVFSSLQNSYQYSGQSQQCFSLDGLHSFSYFQIFHPLYQSFVDRTECTNYNWYYRHFHLP